MGCVWVVLSLTLLTCPNEQWISNSSGVCWAQQGHPAQCQQSKVTRKCPAEPCLTARATSRWGEWHGTQATFITTDRSFYLKWDPENLKIRLSPAKLGPQSLLWVSAQTWKFIAREAQARSDFWICIMILILFWLTHLICGWDTSFVLHLTFLCGSLISSHPQ